MQRGLAAAAVGFLVCALAGLVLVAADVVWMPGYSFNGMNPIPSLWEKQIEAGLRHHIGKLAGSIGERNMGTPGTLERAAQYIEGAFKSQGYKVRSQWFLVDGKRVRNLEAELPGSSQANEIVVVGAHYDSVPHCPGANDNASGVAGMLELSRLLLQQKLARTVRFVAFVNEEDPYFGTEQMGSERYAQELSVRGEDVKAMMAVETIGYHSNRNGSQKLPPLCDLIYPSTGNFVWFVGNQQSKDLVRRSIATFRRSTPFPSEGLAAPEWIEGVDWSDQLYFWKNGYPGMMVTDSAPYRYPFYHTPEDTPDKIDYRCCARIISGLDKVVCELANNRG